MIAEKTLIAIDESIERDNGSRFRGLQREEFNKLTDAFDAKEDEGFRTHLGASIIGRPCARDIWYGWHWAKRSQHSGRLLRLFNRGHLEEARFLAMLRLIGCEVWSTGADGKQLRISGCSGHFGGSLDAVASGIPDNPGVPHLCEFKTHGNKSFSLLKSEGVKQSKWEHYVQMQLYMHAQLLTDALYMAVNKDTDELYAELVPYVKETAERYLQRAQSIIDATEPPNRINSNASWYQCKCCSHLKMCHAFEYPEVNCRTCAHSSPAEDGRWYCERKSAGIPKNCQACDDHVYNPSMLNGIEIVEANQTDNWMIYRLADGTIIDTRE